jgi:hypothetical protein
MIFSLSGQDRSGSLTFSGKELDRAEVSIGGDQTGALGFRTAGGGSH